MLKKQKKTSLVTGGAGFIGSHVAKWLLKAGHRVIVVDDLSGGNRQNIVQGVEFIQASIADAANVQAIFTENRIDYVYHLAAYAAENLSHFIRHYNYQQNLIAGIHLINESVRHNIRCFVFTSSVAVYSQSSKPMAESHDLKPSDPYGIAKLALEWDLQAARKIFDLNYIIFRPHNVYGIGQQLNDRYRNVIAIFMNQIMQKKPLSIYGDGSQSRAFSHIDDVAPYIAASIEQPQAYNQIFNIGSSQTYTINHIAKTIQHIFNQEHSIEYLKSRQENLHVSLDHSKFRQTFSVGIGDGVILETGLSEMAQWALRQGPVMTKSFAEIEINRNLPQNW